MAKEKAEAPEGEEAKGGGKKKLLIIVGALVLVLGGVYYMFFMGGDAEAAPAPVEGEVVVADPVHINLADGHYLKVGLALQVIEGPAHEPDPSKALDLMIAEFSGAEIKELENAKKLKEIKKHLAHEIEEAYHHDVMGIYFTEFVVQ